MNINDLTIKEVKDICDSQEDCLPTCPFYTETSDYHNLECIFNVEPVCYWPDRTEEDEEEEVSFKEVVKDYISATYGDINNL